LPRATIARAMTCPFLSSSRPQCRAVAGAPHPVPVEVTAAYCRAAPASCPALRYLRATGHPAHPADFRAWVLRGVRPGRSEPEGDAARSPDAE
jgi:hypothetical protein